MRETNVKGSGTHGPRRAASEAVHWASYASRAPKAMTSTTITAGGSRSSSASASRGTTVALAALTALALALRVTSLSRSLFTDEVYSLALAQRSFGHMVALFGYEANGTLYSIVLWPLIRVFGDSEQLLRLPAVIAGVASVPAMWWAARQFAGRTVPLVAAALLAVNPMAAWYSQEARAYSFVVLTACLGFGALAYASFRADGARAAWIGYVAAMAAMAYCDLLAIPLALPASCCWLAAEDPGRCAAGAVRCSPCCSAACRCWSRRASPAVAATPSTGCRKPIARWSNWRSRNSRAASRR